MPAYRVLMPPWHSKLREFLIRLRFLSSIYLRLMVVRIKRQSPADDPLVPINFLIAHFIVR